MAATAEGRPANESGDALGGSVPMPLESGEIALRISDGDRAAETELFSRYAPVLVRLLRYWSGSASAAQDLLQETFLIALLKVRGGEPRNPGRLAAYLRGLAHNLAREHVRRRNRRGRIEGELDVAPERGDERERDPLGELLRHEDSRRLLSALGGLDSARDREVLRRFYLAEQDKATICLELGIPDRHFKRVVFRARQRLRRILEQGAAAPKSGTRG